MFKVEPYPTPKGLVWWYSQRKEIDFEPPYQRRGRLWSRSDKQFLVDSVLNDYDIPKVYIADFTFGHSKLNSKKLPFALIDGKQRLEALFDFFAGDIALADDFVYKPNPELKLAGLGYSDLKKNHPTIAEKIDYFPLSVMRVITDSEEQIKELFLRLNRSKPLTGAEIRNAMAGPVPEILRIIVEHDLFKVCIAFPVARREDLNAAAKLLLFEYGGKPTETKKSSLDRFAADHSATSPGLVKAGQRVVDVMVQMIEVFIPRDSLLSSAGALPVYYWFVKETPEEQHHQIREFLLDFERARKAIRDATKAAGAPAHKGDRDFVDYDNYNRSTNDERSYAGRIKILRERFADYLEQQNARRAKGTKTK